MPYGSIIIPAYNEATVIARCLDALLDARVGADFEIVVVCNGCTDGTAEVARRYSPPVKVVELVEGSKPAALRAGDELATSFPRIYLDADVVLPGGAARQLSERLQAGAPAARPPAVYDLANTSRLVQSYYRARTALPAVMDRALWGAGVYGLSSAGRGRFGAFPDLVGDDLWVDRHFTADEIEIVDCQPVVVSVPRRARDLLAVLQRTYRGKAESAPVEASEATRDTLHATLRDLVQQFKLSRRQAIDATVYAAFAIIARLALKVRRTRTADWERDESSRAV